MLDKLDLYSLSELVPLDNFSGHLKTRQLTLKREKYENNKNALRVVGKDCPGRIFIIPKICANGLGFKSIQTNPSSFKTYQQYLSTMENVFDSWLNFFAVSRIDLAVDEPLKFTEALFYTDVKLKRKSSRFDENSGRPTGISIGSDKHQLVIYDNEEQNKRKPHMKQREQGTRYELRYRGEYLQTKDIYKIPSWIGNPKFSPYSFLSLLQTEMNVTDEVSVDKKIKAAQFEILAKNCGYFSARKKLNPNNNFQRDFGCLIVRKDIGLNLNADFYRNMRDYLIGFPYQPPNPRQ